MEAGKRTEIATHLQAQAAAATTPDEIREVLCLALMAYAQVEDDVFRAEHADFTGWKHARETWASCVRTLFGELPTLLAGMHAVSASLDEGTPAFSQAPAEIQERLRNRKDGLSIVGRMVEQLLPRQQALEKLITDDQHAPEPCLVAPEPYLARLETLTDTHGIEAHLAHILEELGDAENDVRDANYQCIRTLRLQVEALKQAVLGFLRDHLLPVSDGLERGLWDEQVMRQSLRAYQAEHEVIDQWFEAYHHYDHLLQAFLLKVGLRRVPVTRGDTFNPHWHMALGHGSCLELTDGHILAVLRSGWICQDVLVRPAEVLVVKNEERGQDAQAEPTATLC